MESLIKVLKQTSFQVVGKVATSLSALIILGVVTRSYGVTGTGVYTLALTYLAFFYLATDLGLNSYVLKKLTDDKSLASKLFNLRLCWSIILFILANFLALFMPFKDPLFNQSVFFGSLSIVLYGIFNSANLIFQSKLRYDQSIIASSIGSLVTVPVVLYYAFTNAPAPFLMLATVFGWAINNLVALVLLKKLGGVSLSFIDFKFVFETVKKAWPISLTILLNVVYFRIDSFILSSHFPFSEVGKYNIAYQIFQSALVLPTFIMNSYYPLMLEQLRTNRNKFISQIKTATLLLFILALSGTLLTLILAPLVIQIISGDNFPGSVLSLRILSLSFPAFFISSLLMWTLVSLEKYKQMALIYFLGLLINLILNFIFIPQHSFIAASWVTGISEYLILILQIVTLYQDLKNR